MMRFVLPYDPDTAPIIDLVGLGFRPAWQPADFIGPRMDCPMWLVAPDADTPMNGKVPSAKMTGLPINPYGIVADLPSILPRLTAAEMAQGNVQKMHIAGHWHPIQPRWPDPWTPGPDYPCQCIEVPPANPQPAPVSIEASSALLLLTGLVALTAWRRS
ncbi:hypothetical protein [Paracoccus aerius]|uniref:PEP-CTERM sorting domain-containing protein n=1 Tax=Paracoccus aerius TaxID=1915382 RepID=A0ABS1S6A7_9RHOB|nr:hypothetical protein [Paracoccus aerius]MBL3674262.1 hypothetical protein [Paracoccus aerius]GHG24450.1 hypothetical protein GCM10017322_23010 [Paracoccus aerius]